MACSIALVVDDGQKARPVLPELEPLAAGDLVGVAVARRRSDRAAIAWLLVQSSCRSPENEAIAKVVGPEQEVRDKPQTDHGQANLASAKMGVGLGQRRGRAMKVAGEERVLALVEAQQRGKTPRAAPRSAPAAAGVKRSSRAVLSSTRTMC